MFFLDIPFVCNLGVIIIFCRPIQVELNLSLTCFSFAIRNDVRIIPIFAVMNERGWKGPRRLQHFQAQPGPSKNHF